MENYILIKNGLILTMEPEQAVIENGCIIIKDSLIDFVGRCDAVPERYAIVSNMEIIDASNCIVMPGLVNCHTHLPMSMFRGLADDLPLEKWLNEHIFPAEAKEVNPESVEKWSLLSCKELLLSGTTTCCDGYFYEKEVAEAALSSGIRAVLGQGIIDFPAPGVPDPLKNIENAVDFVENMSDKSSRLYPSIFCHSPYTCSKQTLQKAKKAADAGGIIFQIHVGEIKNEKNMIRENKGLSSVRYLNSIGVLDENTLLVHCVWVDEKDIEIIKKSGASIVHCAESNMKLASGIAPVTKFLKAAIPTGLGTDGSASNNNLDLFTEMDMAAKLHKAALSDPCVMKAEEVLKMATTGGAEALGLDKITGSIRAGKKADIIIIDTDAPHLVPMYNPCSSLVYSAKGSDVRDVIVDGKILESDGVYIALG